MLYYKNCLLYEIAFLDTKSTFGFAKHGLRVFQISELDIHTKDYKYIIIIKWAKRVKAVLTILKYFKAHGLPDSLNILTFIKRYDNIHNILI